MDAPRFDALARAAGAISTRRGLSSLLATASSLLVLGTLTPDVAARKKKRRKQQNARIEGPCGNGGDKANRCRRNRQCCTGYCKKRKSRRKKNGRRRKVRGRCRCRKTGQRCTDDTNCCPERTGRACLDGACRIPTCTDLCPDGCCDGETCLAGDSDDACGAGGAPCLTCSGDTAICFAGSCMCGDVCADGCRYPTIQAATDDPDGPEVIRLCAETYTETITIARDLTLTGAGQEADGTILDGERQGNVVTVLAATVELQGLRITGGDILNSGGVGISDEGGGGIYNSGNLTVANCTVIDNLATNPDGIGIGGGIFNNDGTLTMSGCMVSGNTASDGGGGIYNDFNDTISLTNCTVTGNTVTGGRGGGIDNREGGTMNLSNCRVTGNTASTEGGGIYNHTGSTVNLANASSVANNTNGNCDGPGNYHGSGCA